jgi:hypothetical protein
MDVSQQRHDYGIWKNVGDVLRLRDTKRSITIELRARTDPQINTWENQGGSGRQQNRNIAVREQEKRTVWDKQKKRKTWRLIPLAIRRIPPTYQCLKTYVF